MNLHSVSQVCVPVYQNMPRCWLGCTTCKSVHFADFARLIRALGWPQPPRYIHYCCSTALLRQLQLVVQWSLAEQIMVLAGMGGACGPPKHVPHTCHHPHCPPPNHPCSGCASNRSRFLIFSRTHLGEERPDRDDNVEHLHS